ncbi:MAG TPA: Mut7-C RNAse domain-containing protein [Desulfobacteraceae bacterium]|nr:Mut7-C RNAse domain-containing protein [Desulfobacteraceae bacterium]HPQ30024.1 Mut7-C RNAse domain-containing protein [Desulfobacteraceae bacterium]
MPKVTLRFYEELNHFLKKDRRKTDFQVDYDNNRSIKDMIESLGVPHTEVDLILKNGESVDFSYIIKDGDRFSIYPAFESLNISKVTRLRKIPLRRTEFIADINIGDIVRYMRALGFDVFFDPLLTIREIIEISGRENRIILTKSRRLLKFSDVTHGIYVHPGKFPEQIKRIIQYLDIKDTVKPFSRCLLCNGLLLGVEKDKIINRIPQKTRSFCNEFSYCKKCDKYYWKGTHWIHMKEVLDRILDD